MFAKQFSKIVAVSSFSLLLAGLSLVVSPSKVQAARFIFDANNSQVVTGCESVLNIMIDTEGVETNAADAVVFYNPEEIEIVDQDTEIAGIQIRNGNVYSVYAGNKVDETTGKIYLTAFDILSTYQSNGQPGTYGSIVFKAKPGVTSSTFSFDFVVGSTKDSNIANLAGADVLTSVNDLTFSFGSGFCGTDSTPPQISNISPKSGSKDNPLNSNISFTITDNLAGIDLDKLEVTVDRSTYQTGSEGLSVSGDANNYEITIDPVENFSAETLINVEISASDAAGNVMSPYKWSFNQPEIDEEPPYVSNPYPTPLKSNVPLSSSVSFNLKDDLSGVDINTVVITIAGHEYEINDHGVKYSGDPTNYFITIKPVDDFKEDELVRVSIEAIDLRYNIMPTYSYIFNDPLTDNTPPYINSLKPRDGDRGVDLDTEVKFHIMDDIAGVDINSIEVQINDVYYTLASDELTFFGDKNNYAIVVQPQGGLPAETLVEVLIDVEDLNGNVMDTESYEFNRPAECGDNLVELAEECEPPGSFYCSDECKINTDISLEDLEQIHYAAEIQCGNNIVDPGEECEPPGSAVCDENCNIISTVEVGECLTLADEGTNSLDSDDDGLPDILEYQYQTSPLTDDSDGDGISDIEEILDYGSDPNDASPIKINTSILNWKNGDKTGSKKILLKGTSKADQDLKIYAINSNEERILLSNVKANEENKFVVVSDPDLPEGEYKLVAETYSPQGNLVDKSEEVRVVVDYANRIPPPQVESISGEPVPDLSEGDFEIKIEDNKPTVYGSTVQNSMVFVSFESLITTAAIIADSTEGDFAITAPKELELGKHRLNAYSVTENGLVSDPVVIEFEITPQAEGLTVFDWMYIIIVLSLIVFLVAEYRRWKRRGAKLKTEK